MQTSHCLVSVLAILIRTVYGWRFPDKPDYMDHPCERDCLSSAGPRRCEYNFTLEHYQTLSRACYDCPSRGIDCSRPHCVPGDGSRRAIKVVNRMMPGPAIHVCREDTVVVNVYNELNDFEGTSIHWHGVLQRGTPHMDGVAMVTQCPIPAHSMFQYKFKVQEAGTHYWHAHAGQQRGDGVFGAIVVRETVTSANMRLYDYDLPEHTMTVQDWLDQYTSSKFALHHHGIDDNSPTSILINGRGQLLDTPVTMSSHDMHAMSANDSTSMTSTTTTTTMNMNISVDMSDMDEDMDHGNEQPNVPHHVFRVTRGMRYRFRVISNGVLNCPLKVSLDQHNLTLIASDGSDIHPVEVDSFVIFAGERYDVVIDAREPVGNYWIRVIGLGDCEKRRVSQTAILRYEGAMAMNPEAGESYSDGDRIGLTANPLHHTGDVKSVDAMTSDESMEPVDSPHGVKKFYLAMDFNNVANDVFLHPDYYPLSYFTEMGGHGTHLYALQINHITNGMPSSPLLSQYSAIAEGYFCNETSTAANCREEFCRCLHRIKLELGDIVELVLISEGRHGMGNHPMHLHGHSFHVIGMQKVNSTITREEVETMDRRGRLMRNLQNPVKKDTVMVPDGGYTIIRFKADNPGFWFFHCHVDFHLTLGMSMVIQVGEPHQMTPVPRNFPKCGNWDFVESSECTKADEDCVNSSQTLLYSANTVMLIAMTLVCRGVLNL